MAVPMRCHIVQLFIYVVLFNNEILSNSLKPCTLSSFENIVLPCSLTERKRKSVYYMNEECDLKHTNSVSPLNLITYLPCDCDAGYGQVNNTNSNITCVKCKPGQFSYGGEVLSDFKNWYDSSGVAGLFYRAYSYCSDFLSRKPCKSWTVGGGGEYLVSGETKNSTELRCFEQSILVLSRQFSGSPGNNRVSFLYRVDGKECEHDSSSSCSNGLFFFVNGEQKMNSESQFQWKEFSVDVNPGTVRLKFVYQRSCTRTNILDVAFIKQISLVGTVSKESKCLECPAGSYSSSDGSKECVKCSQNDYQDKPGQTKCIPCPIGEFSGIGASSCMKLPNCTQRDFYLLPDSISKCTKDSTGAWFRNQTVLIPNWSNVSTAICNEIKDAGDQYKRPDNLKVQCFCQPGFFLNTSGPTPKCSMCSVGKYSNGFQNECLSCKPGYAASPGFYMDHFPEGPLPKIMRQSCSGQYCKDGETFWEPRGNYIATRRLPGTFETTLEVNDVFVNYFNASLSFNCSLDCRLSSDDSKLAKLSDCFLRLVVLKDGKSIIEEDCVSKYMSNLRNGTIMAHQYSLSDPGKYSFKVIFHHEDEGNFSLISFEGRIYFIDLLGAIDGSSKQCVECPAGMILSKDKSTCIKCPNGTYSGRGASTCIPCPKGTFASEEGSESCVKCGDGTTSNERRDDCEYNGCRFSPEQGLNFDLSPLSVDGGPMYEVKIYRPFINFYFPPQVFYINICSKNHDNTSCVTSVREMDPVDKTTKVVKQIFLKTMACKRYYFDRFNSLSIGEVLSFKALEGDKKRDGLKIILSGGSKCWNKMTRSYTSPQTTILMMCDLEAGVNRPEQLNNFTAIDDRPCINEFLWKTTYACPICTPDDYSEVFSECKNGTQYKTKTRKTKCRLSVGENDIVFKSFPCTQDSRVSLKGSKDTTLVITILIAIVLIIALIIILIYNIRRNRYLRSNLFAPGQTFSKVQREDEDELVDNMQS